MEYILMVLFALLARYSTLAPVQDYLIPFDSCALPCQLGIALGETPTLDADAILSAHLWIEDDGLPPVFAYGEDRYALILMTQVGWRWNGEQPDWLDGWIRAHLRWRDDGGDPALRDLRVTTTLTIGDTWLLLGMPQAGYALPMIVRTGNDGWDEFCNYSLYDAIYDDGRLRVRAFVPRPLRLVEFFRTEVEVEFYSEEWGIDGGLHPINHAHCASMLP
jgi:hypothetical protein